MFDSVTVTPDMVLHELAVIALRHAGGELPAPDEPVKVAEQLKALEMIGKYLGMFRDAVPDESPAMTLVCDYGDRRRRRKAGGNADGV